MKQGDEKIHLAKDEGKTAKNYIFQKNTKTKVGFFFILVVLVFLTLLVVFSGAVFQE